MKRRFPILLLVAGVMAPAGACNSTVDSATTSSGGSNVYCDEDRGEIPVPKHPLSFAFCKTGEICGIEYTNEYFSCCVEGPHCCQPPNPHVASCD
jgi:hypothetical protein